MSTNRFAAALSVLVASVLVVVAVTPAQQTPIKIGFTTDLTGTAAQAAKDMVNGFTMYLDEVGGQMAGRKVELIVEDTQGRPDVALTKLRKLVEHDRVHLVAGVLFGHLGYAMAPKVEEYKIPALFTVTAADDLTQRLKYRWIIRTGWASSQPSHPFGEYAAKTLGYRKVAVIASDYAFGWEVVGGFQRTFEENGGQVVQKLWAPLGAMDLAPFIAKLRRDVDAVLTMIAGASTIQFMKQYEEAGLKGKIPLIAGGPAVDEALLPSMGDEAIGVISPLIYSGALDTPANRRFAREYRAKFGKVPSYFAETNYTSGRWINEAVRSLAGNVEDREKMLAALRKVEIPDAPRGPVKLDGYGNPIQNVYFRKVERNREGELQNTVIVTIPAVSQFWKYNPEEFLKQPVYSRDVPPCRYC
ncbi:MAG: ABC transporter substrate-binding protein [Candidatus Rokuibacteriota bacterium]|nr:MAG: ABC transporter substrate-binding protein [Candidatus Rokubacteria bacterium]